MICKFSRKGFYPILMSAMAAAVPVGKAEEPAGPQDALTYTQSCIAPYQEALAGWHAPHLTREYYQRVVRAIRETFVEPCTAFVEQRERVDAQLLGAAEQQELLNARNLLANTLDGQRIEAQLIADTIRSAETLYRLWLRTPPDEREVSLLQEAVEIDPNHLGALLLLTNADLDSQARSKYGVALYELSEDIDYRLNAAKAIIEGAVDRGDLVAILDIRERVQQDLYSQRPLRRCAGHLDILGLRHICIEAIEIVASRAEDAGSVLPLEILSRMGDLIWEIGLSIGMPTYIRSEAEVADLLATPGVRDQLFLAYENDPEILNLIQDEVELARWMRGTPEMVEILDRYERLAIWLEWEPWEIRTAAQVNRLKAVLENYPEPLRSPDHYLALADAASTWGERIESLQRAVEIDDTNGKARCQLAQAMTKVGDVNGAGREYQSLLAFDNNPCSAQAEIAKSLRGDTPPDAAQLDEPQELFFYLR